MRLIRGAPGSGKTAQVFREFKAALREGRRNLRIVVPTATLVRHFQHELARDGLVFPPGAIVSLNRFAAERAGAARLVPDGLLRAITRDILRRTPVPELGEVANTDGMVRTVLETIDLFENAGCTPDTLASARRLSAPGHAFVRIWREVAAAVGARGDVFRAATANSEPLHVWMDGFIHLSHLERELVASLEKTSELVLTLIGSPAADDIRRFAMQLGAEDRLLPGPSRRPDITIAAAPCIEREADEIAHRILELNSRGVQFREMGIALRDPGLYASLLRATLERFGIPARFYFASPLKATFLSGLITAALHGWEFGATLEALGEHPAWGRSAAFDRFDFAVREAMPGHGADSLLALAEEEFAPRLRECFAIDSWRTEALRPSDWARRMTRMGERLYYSGMLDAPRDFRDVEMSRNRAAVLNCWLDSIATATEFWPDRERGISLEEFWRVASAVLDGASLHLIDNRHDVVHVLSAHEARQWDLRALFVCGMTNRDYPRRHPQNLLFPDSDLEALCRAGIPVRTSEDLDRDEEVLWESLQSRATESLILSYPERDAAGKTLEPSRCVRNIGIEVQTTSICRATPPVERETPGVGGHVVDPALLALMTDRHRNISLTSLEELAQCRFKFLAGRTLGLQSRPERPGERLHPKLTGSILHKALETWLNENRAGDFTAHFEEAFDRARHENHLPEGYRLEVERILNRAIAEKVRATEQWTALSSETEVELTFDLPGGINVKCRVDRIDHLTSQDCVIIDYKSSRTQNVEKLVASETRLQGPLYALAVREKRNLRTLAMMYVAVRDDKRFGWGEVPGVDLGLVEMPMNWIENARARTIERIENFLSGAVYAQPSHPDDCRFCDYKAACRVEEREALVMIEGAGVH